MGLFGGLFYLSDDLRKQKIKKTSPRKFLSRPINENLAYLLAAYLILRLVILSGRVIWWGGTGAFGARHMINFFPVAILFYAYMLNRLMGNRYQKIIILITIPMILWSMLLYFANPSEKNFYTYSGLINHQIKTVISLATTTPSIPVFIVSTIIFIFAIRYLKHFRDKKFLSTLLGLTLLFITLIHAHYPRHLAVYWEELYNVPYNCVMLAVASALLFYHKEIISRIKINWEMFTTILFIFLVLYLVGSGFNSIKLVKENHIGDYRYCGTFQVEDWIECYNEYLEIGGYKEEKVEFRKNMDEYLNYIKSNTSCYEQLGNRVSGV